MTVNITVPADWDRRGLPGWTYSSPALFDLERQHIFLTHWHVAGHISDVAGPGDWITFDMLGERALILRGQDGVLRAFHNLCRHRGARVVDGAQGTCRATLVCSFHGWVYNTDGTLRGPARPETFGDMDPAGFGLKPIEIEVFHGFVFLRFSPGPQPAVATLLAPFGADFAAYDTEALLPASVSDGHWQSTLPVNWKSVRDVDNEGYHVAMAHPGLQELYGRTYVDLFHPDGLSSSHATFGDVPGRGWSVRHYVKHAPEQADLPPHLRRAWTYYGMFPSSVFAFTPEGAQYYQDVPLGPNDTAQRGRIYRRPHETRAARLARYLACRIDRETSDEDRQLSIWSNESMKSSAFEGFHLSDLEYGVRAHHDRIRAILPVVTLGDAPPEAHLARINEELLWGSDKPQ